MLIKEQLKTSIYGYVLQERAIKVVYILWEREPMMLRRKLSR